MNLFGHLLLCVVSVKSLIENVIFNIVRVKTSLSVTFPRFVSRDINVKSFTSLLRAIQIYNIVLNRKHSIIKVLVLIYCYTESKYNPHQIIKFLVLRPG